MTVLVVLARMVTSVDKFTRVGRLGPSRDEVAILVSSMAQTTNDASLRATKCQQTQDLRTDRNAIIKERDNGAALATLREERIHKLEATNSELQGKYDELVVKQEIIEAKREGMTNTMEEWLASTNGIRGQNMELLLRLETSRHSCAGIGRRRRASHNPRNWLRWRPTCSVGLGS